MPKISETEYRAAIAIENGEYKRNSSERSALKKGRPSDTSGEKITIQSSKDDLNGVLVRGGKSAFTLSHSDISLNGTGSNDFLGLGAGAMVAEGVLILDDVRIVTEGAISSATVAADDSVMKVYNSTLISKGGPLPDDYTPRIGPGMMEPPAPLEITGTARTNITMGRSESYFYSSTIKADGWGALSTDATGGDVYLEADGCTIIVENSGYGAYADFGAHVVIKNSKMDAATYGAIIAGEAKVEFNNVTGVEGRNAVMIHSVMGRPTEVADLVISGGDIKTGAEGVLVKSANARIVFDNAGLKSNSGELLKIRVNEDPFATKTNGQKVPGVSALFRDGQYAGGIIDEDPDRDLNVKLENAVLSGPLQGATLSIGEGGRWISTSDSAVRLEPFDVSAIDAPEGVTISAVTSDSNANVKSTYVLNGGGRLNIVRQ